MAKRPQRSEGEKPAGSFIIDPENIVESLAEVVKGIPEGVHCYAYDSKTHTLVPEAEGMRPEELPPTTIGIAKHGDTVEVARGRTINNLSSRSTCLSLNFEEGNLRTAYYQDGYYAEPNFSVSIENQEGEIASAGRIRMILVNGIQSLSLIYSGNSREMAFEAIEDLTEGERELVWGEGGALTINLSEYLHQRLFLDYPDMGKEIPHPSLSFDPDRHDLVPGLGYAYLSWDKRSLPKVEAGEIIQGVCITDEEKSVVGLKISIAEAEEVPYKYTHKIGKAVNITANIEANNGKGDIRREEKKLTVLGDMDYVRMHPEDVVGYAWRSLEVA